MLHRRGFLLGLGALAAPAIVKASSLMPVRTPLWTPPAPVNFHLGRGQLFIGDVVALGWHKLGDVGFEFTASGLALEHAEAGERVRVQLGGHL